MVTVKRHCQTLPDGRVTIEITEGFMSLRKIHTMDLEDAIHWIQNYAPKHCVYIIDGVEYRRVE